MHRDQLRHNWERARAHDALEPIDPLPSMAVMVAVTYVEPLDEYNLRLRFDDGSERVVDHYEPASARDSVARGA
jgi:hypothetical protein